jgi:hypothetical protein
MQATQTVRVEVEGIVHSGVSKSNKPYFILSTYVTLPGLKHPQACNLFSDKTLMPGDYEAPLVFSIEDKRPAAQIDLAAAQPARAAAASRAQATA